MRSSHLLLALLALLLALAGGCAPKSRYQPQAEAKTDMLADYDPEKETQAGPPEVADPLQGFNRAMFTVNDRLYFWVLKPVGQGYAAVVPETGRIGVRNFFRNIFFPIRFVNSVLQFKLLGAERELARFIINTGSSLGFADIAYNQLQVAPSDEDFGQTLAFYGLDDGFYIVWPLLGPSSLRDTAGRVGDWPLSPLGYVEPWYVPLAARGVDVINSTSLRIGEYEALKDASVDPYAALRNAYIENRWEQVRQ